MMDLKGMKIYDGTTAQDKPWDFDRIEHSKIKHPQNKAQYKGVHSEEDYCYICK